MDITKDVISDLFPIYVANECSADTRALVDEYLRGNPQQAEELQRIMSAPLPGVVPPAKGLDEVRSRIPIWPSRPRRSAETES